MLRVLALGLLGVWVRNNLPRKDFIWGWCTQPHLCSTGFISVQGLRQLSRRDCAELVFPAVIWLHGRTEKLLSLTLPDFPGEELLLLSGTTMLL